MNTQEILPKRGVTRKERLLHAIDMRNFYRGHSSCLDETGVFQVPVLEATNDCARVLGSPAWHDFAHGILLTFCPATSAALPFLEEQSIMRISTSQE